MKEVKFGNTTEKEIIEEIELIEEKNEFSCIVNLCPVNIFHCLAIY